MSDDKTIDTTAGNSLEEADSPQAGQPSAPDPAMAITVALANELQQVYANNPSKLNDANRALRAAYKGNPKPKS